MHFSVSLNCLGPSGDAHFFKIRHCAFGLTFRRMSDALRTQWINTLSQSFATPDDVLAAAPVRVRCCFSACTCAAPARACTENSVPQSKIHHYHGILSIPFYSFYWC
jgi:hypothetical protein